jgi:pimeloyl-ACP methyl ester carboxylesterase
MAGYQAMQQETGVSPRAFGAARLQGVLSGKEDGRPGLVLLHGLTFDSRMWEPAVAALRRIDPARQLLVLDLPGHGGSPAQETYGLEAVSDAIALAVADAGLVAPVLVGHSISGLIATLYVTRHSGSGVVNVDQSFDSAFTRMLHANRATVTGPEFPRMWQGLLASMQIELLPVSAQHLLSTAIPSQQLVVGYWEAVLNRQPDELDSMVRGVLESVRTSGMPYIIIAGHDYDAAYIEWLRGALPGVRIVSLPRCGHFPHLAEPDAVARLLASTGEWMRR